MIKFSQQEIDNILDLFLNQGVSRNQISKKFNCDICVINRILLENNIDYANHQNKYGRKYFFDQHYFQYINTEEKAYWLGFLYADGYITGQNVFGCGLQLNDKEHLIKFLTAIQCSSYDCISIEENSVRFSLTDELFVNHLIDKGFTHQKSYDTSTIIWDSIPDNYKKDFIRGLWDGDGYVSKTAQNANITGMVSNNKNLLLKIIDYFNENFGENFTNIVISDGYPRIRLAAVKAYKVCCLLYQNSTVYLERKYQAYLNLNPPCPKYNKKYSYLKKLPSNRYYIYIPHNGKKETVGTFDTVEQAIYHYNLKAKEYGKSFQIYKGEEI